MTRREFQQKLDYWLRLSSLRRAGGDARSSYCAKGTHGQSVQDECELSLGMVRAVAGFLPGTGHWSGQCLLPFHMVSVQWYFLRHGINLARVCGT